MQAVEIKHLTKKFTNNQIAVRDLTLSINQGEVFGFLGPNGAGKTTTIKLLNGMLQPTSGKMQILGEDPTKDPIAIHQFSGVLTERAAMYDQLTGMENLLFYGEVFGLSQEDSRKRGLDLLEQLELSYAADRKLTSYSTGMRQRLSLARAMIHQPKVLFLDEPTSGLDPESVLSVNRLIQDLAKNQGVTVFLCTHQLRYAQEICTSYGLLDEGELLATGTLESLRHRVSKGLKVEVQANRISPDLHCKLLGKDRFEFTLIDEQEIPELVRKIVQSGSDIYGVTAKQLTLEEIYFALLEEGGPVHD
ncbi:ABC transporter ATP-binding protein [Enterococcus sp. 669A]|uniref:ABC transporter ATP-binding protein n=1 Tax=Candidatus Enterococcus moelleringii TaxID=2815325 RepID=A0ABS3LE76_9ENTE|nr:ABC transporter ATP-binding protein [Enterococcus sp. 669A]MBO1307937.1 ABC transporter ATP-binding protein [Enterococcus sp. 669A]